MQLIDFVDEVERITLYAMEDRLREVLKYMLFLADHVICTPVEMKHNNNAFLW